MSAICEIEDRSVEADRLDFADQPRARAMRRTSRRGLIGKAALAGVTLLLAALAWPMLRGRVYIADDLGAFHLPMRAFYSQQLAAGESSDWCPQLFGGFYLTGEGQVGSYHPLHLILYRLLPLRVAFDLECWLSYPAMLAGMYVLLRRWRFRRGASLAGAMFFAFSGFSLLHFMHPNAIAVVAHLPWLLVALVYMVRGPVRRTRYLACAGVALLTGSQLLLGYPQYVLFSLMAEGVYLAALLWRQTPGKWARAFCGWMAALAIGALIGGTQLLPTFDALANSARASAETDFAAQGSLHPQNAAQLVAPYLFDSRVVGDNTHEFGLYLGAVPLVLAVWLLTARRGNANRPLTIFSLAIVTIGLLWAFGEFGPLGWLQTHLPLLNRFRFSCRAIVLVQLGIAILAAVGLAAIAASQNRKASANRLWLLPIASTVISLLAVAIWPDHVAPWPMIVAGPLLLAVAVLLVARATNGAQWALAALVLLAAVDLGVYGMSYSVFGKTDSLANYEKRVSTPQAPRGSRVALETDQGPNHLRIGNQILLAGFNRIDGYAGLEPQRQLNYSQPAALRVAGVQFVAVPGSAEWRRVDGSRPRAWLVGKAVPSVCPIEDITRIQLAEEALIDEPLAADAHLAVPATPPIVTIQLDRPGHISATTESTAAQLLVVNESYHNGWYGVVDGVEARVLRADGDFLGVVVPAGQHRITLDFQPRSLLFGRIASGLGLGLLGAVVLLGWRKPSLAPPKTCSTNQAA